MFMQLSPENSSQARQEFFKNVSFASIKLLPSSAPRTLSFSFAQSIKTISTVLRYPCRFLFSTSPCSPSLADAAHFPHYEYQAGGLHRTRFTDAVVWLYDLYSQQGSNQQPQRLFSHLDKTIFLESAISRFTSDLFAASFHPTLSRGRSLTPLRSRKEILDAFFYGLGCRIDADPYPFFLIKKMEIDQYFISYLSSLTQLELPIIERIFESQINRYHEFQGICTEASPPQEPVSKESLS